jgi:hypothetical protein
MSRGQQHDMRFACVVDGDNVTRGGQLQLGAVAQVLRRVAALTEGVPVTFAMQTRQAKAYMTAYAGMGWGIRIASMAPDAADDLLREAARDYFHHAVSDLVVVSGDHAFAELAGQARLHVVTYRDCLSKRLRLAATSVAYLDGYLGQAA